MESKSEDYKPINGLEKDFFQKQAVSQNNDILFSLIKDQVDSLVNLRLLDFMKNHPAIFKLEKQTTIVRCS
jgi:hypothetical protein